MSSLSRTYARANRLTMRQHQGPGAYAEGERQHKERLAKKRAEHARRKANG